MEKARGKVEVMCKDLAVISVRIVTELCCCCWVLLGVPVPRVVSDVELGGQLKTLNL